jgi:hypothetical protein
MVLFEEEMMIVREEPVKLEPMVYIPGIYLKLAVNAVQALRGDVCQDARSETVKNVCLIARASALAEARSIVSLCDIKDGICRVASANVCFDNIKGVDRIVDDTFFQMSSIITGELKGIDVSGIVQSCREQWGSSYDWNALQIKQLIMAGKTPTGFKKMAGWIYENETIHKYRIYEVMAEYLEAYELYQKTG